MTRQWQQGPSFFTMASPLLFFNQPPPKHGTNKHKAEAKQRGENSSSFRANKERRGDSTTLIYESNMYVSDRSAGFSPVNLQLDKWVTRPWNTMPGCRRVEDCVIQLWPYFVSRVTSIVEDLQTNALMFNDCIVLPQVIVMSYCTKLTVTRL